VEIVRLNFVILPIIRPDREKKGRLTGSGTAAERRAVRVDAAREANDILS